MKISREARNLARQLFDMTLVDGKLDPKRVETVSDAIVQDKPRFYLQILKEFTRRVRLEAMKHHAVIDSAVELDSKSREKVLALLKQKFGEDLQAEFRTAPNLIAGMRVQVGSNVWDGSVLGRLNNLKAQL